MEGDFIKINPWLSPLSWLYGLGVGLRNWLFDIGVLKQRTFSTPVISVGNLTAGGCGKTPHVEYLVNLLHESEKVAVLSRGYKRKTSGYVLAGKSTKMPDIGDEPFQMKEKFSDIYVAVDQNRCHGITRLTTDGDTKDVSVILLDDAYQHRYVKPGVNILLVDYHRLIIYDRLLPAGRLREPKTSKERADIVIITKCPDTLKPIDYRVLSKAMDLRPYQKLFFTSIAYKELVPYNGGETRSLQSIARTENILLVSGIASPKQIATDLSAYCDRIKTIPFADHHQFTTSDMADIKKAFERMEKPKMIVTTEKDAARLGHLKHLDSTIKDNLYILPIEIDFKLDKQQEFDDAIRSYISNTKTMNRTAQASSKH